MKRLIALLFLLASPSFATTTVTGTINNLGTGSSGSATFVRFWLRGCGGNQPRVSGTAVIAPSQGGVFYFDIAANSSGAVSGTLYSTRDSTGNSGGEIECGGSTTSEWYGMQIFVNGQGGPETPIQARNTTTIDISNVTPITTNPVVTAPTGDTTYFRIDGGNSGIKDAAGTITASEPLTGSVPGTFTNIQNNYHFQFLLDSCNPSTEYAAVHGTGASATETEGITGCTLYPSGSTVPVAVGVGGYVQNNVTNGTGVAGNFQVRCLANNSLCFAHNNIAQDAIGVTGAELIDDENDIFLKGSAWGSIIGSFVSGDFGTGSQPSSAVGYLVDPPNFFGSTKQWTVGFSVADGATTLRAFQVGTMTSANSEPSQRYSAFGRNSGGTGEEAYWTADQNGNFVIGTPIGGSAIAPGLIVQQNASPSNPTSGFDKLNFDTSDIFGPLTSAGAFTRSKWSGLIATGTATLTGTGACATLSSQNGGSWDGEVTCTGTTGASTLVITPGTTAPNHWECSGSDVTSGHELALPQSGLSATTCTLKASSVTANDVLSFRAVAH